MIKNMVTQGICGYCKERLPAVLTKHYEYQRTEKEFWSHTAGGEDLRTPSLETGLGQRASKYKYAKNRSFLTDIPEVPMTNHKKPLKDPFLVPLYEGLSSGTGFCWLPVFWR